jgi:hypothetical protein
MGSLTQWLGSAGIPSVELSAGAATDRLDSPRRAMGRAKIIVIAEFSISVRGYG